MKIWFIVNLTIIAARLIGKIQYPNKHKVWKIDLICINIFSYIFAPKNLLFIVIIKPPIHTTENRVTKTFPGCDFSDPKVIVLNKIKKINNKYEKYTHKVINKIIKDPTNPIYVFVCFSQL